MANEICQLFEKRLDLLISGSDAPLSRVRETCTDLWNAVRSRVPTLWREVDATREVVGLAGWQMIVTGAYTDVADLLRFAEPSTSECSVAMDTTRGLLYGTWDSHVGAADCSFVLERRTSRGSSLSLTTAGWPAQYGVNNRGMGFGITNLLPTVTRPDGLVFIAAVGFLSLLRSARESIDWLEDQAFASGHSYLVLDSHDARLAETTGTSIRSRTVGEERAVQCNNYTTGLDKNSSNAFLNGSRQRHDELAEAPLLSTLVELSRWLQSSSRVLRSDPGSPTMTSAFFMLEARTSTLGVTWPDSSETITRSIGFDAVQSGERRG